MFFDKDKKQPYAFSLKILINCYVIYSKYRNKNSKIYYIKTNCFKKPIFVSTMFNEKQMTFIFTDAHPVQKKQNSDSHIQV